MILKINENITDETLNKLILTYNDLKEGEDLTILLNSNGGCVNSAEAILFLIDSNFEKTKIVGYGKLCSCAFSLFFKVKCSKSLLSGCVGMYHQSIMSVDMDERWQTPFSEDKAKKEYLTNYSKNETYEICNLLNLTESEVLKIKKGKDVWFSCQRMIEILKQSEKIIKN